MKEKQFAYFLKEELLYYFKIKELLDQFWKTHIELNTAFNCKDIDKVLELLSYHDINLLSLKYYLNEYKEILEKQK